MINDVQGNTNNPKTFIYPINHSFLIPSRLSCLLVSCIKKQYTFIIKVCANDWIIVMVSNIRNKDILMNALRLVAMNQVLQEEFFFWDVV